MQPAFRTISRSCRNPLMSILCLYDRQRMQLKVLNGALMSHAIVGGTNWDFAENPFYDVAVTSLRDADDVSVLAKLSRLEDRLYWEGTLRLGRYRRRDTPEVSAPSASKPS